jgi:hypothetical protein
MAYDTGTGDVGDIFVDPLTGDIPVVGGDVLLVRGGAFIAQNVLQRLRTLAGEYFLDTTIGIPYVQTIFQKGVNPQVVRTLFRTAIAQTPGIASVGDIAFRYDNGQRLLSLSFSARTNDGQTFSINTGLP